MFSLRTGWDLRPNRLTQILDEKRRQGEKIVDLTASNPTRCCLQYSSEHLINAFAKGSPAQYDPDPKGLLNAREAVSGYYQESGAQIDPNHILLTASTSEAYTFLLKLLCNAGDKVLIPKPSYPLFEHLCQLNDVQPEFYDLVYDGEWHIEFDSLRAKTQNAKAILLVHPNNPTGSFVKQVERVEIVRIARENHLCLIVDEVFAEYCFESPRRANSFVTTDSVMTFTLGGISKLLGLPQMKLSWIAASGPSNITSTALKKLEFIADTFLSVNTPIQQMLPLLLKERKSRTQKIIERVQANFATLRSRATSASGVSLLRCEGGWYALLQVSAARSDDGWAEVLVEDFNTLVHPGHFFGIDNFNCLVMSLLPSPDDFDRGISNLINLVTEKTAVNG